MLGPGKFSFRGILFSLALSDHRSCGFLFRLPLGEQAPRRFHTDHGALTSGFSLLPLSLQLLGVHARQHLSGSDETSFINEDFLDPPGRLGGDVDFGCLDTTVAADNPGREACTVIHPPAIVTASENHDAENGQNPIFSGLHDCIHPVFLSLRESP